jgi:F-type H+-transporting ATPase subunit gamma
VQSTKKITKAMELIAASRIGKAQQRVAASRPYASEITNVLSALASYGSLDHPLLEPRATVQRSGVLVITSDRGLAGGYSANALRRCEELVVELRDEGKEPVLYVVGRKGVSHYRFRNRPIEECWSGFSEKPTFTDVREIGNVLVKAFLAGSGGTVETSQSRALQGIDELHIVSTKFVSMISQQPIAHRLAPIEVTETTTTSDKLPPLYEFEPNSEQLLAALLPKYLNARIYAALLESAASESAARRQAMKSATDNAEELIRGLTRRANQARQAEITQEISEIVGGANALAAAGSES